MGRFSIRRAENAPWQIETSTELSVRDLHPRRKGATPDGGLRIRRLVFRAMKAVRIHSFGGPDVLKVEDLPQPKPGAGEVLIRVEAASVNPVDYKIRSGEFKPDGLRIPLTLGRDVAGVVEEAGRGGSEGKTGGEVYA